MDIRDYEYIVTIAEQESITRAAAQLFITQSALTKFLQRIEKNLGLALFQRKGNKFCLTEFGKTYVEIGQRIMQLDHQLSDQLNSTIASQEKQIRLGHGMGRKNRLIEEILPSFYKKFPDVRIYAYATTSRDQMTMLQNDKLDIAWVSGAERLSEYTYIPVDKAYLSLVVSNNSHVLTLARNLEGYPFPVIPLEALNDIPMVSLPTTTISGHLAAEFFRTQNFSPKIVLELRDLQSVLDAVEHGLGAAIMLSVPVTKRQISFLSIEGVEIIEQPTYLVYRTDKNLSESMEYLIQLIMQV